MNVTRAETQLLERTELSLADHSGNRLDCPDVNVNPPSNSDCQYFDVINGTPVCTKEGNTQRQLESWLSTGIGNVACLNLLSAEETGNQLPGVSHQES